MFSMSTVALAAEPEYKSMMDDAETRQKFLASAYADNVAPNYISVDEYLTKYGTTNVIKGFNKAEIDHKANVLKTANAAEKASLNKDVASFSSEPNDLYLSIKEGELSLDDMYTYHQANANVQFKKGGGSDVLPLAYDKIICRCCFNKMIIIIL